MFYEIYKIPHLGFTPNPWVNRAKRFHCWKTYEEIYRKSETIVILYRSVCS